MSDRNRILRQIERESRYIKNPTARRKFRRAAIQTGLVESNLSNPRGGDADSQGWRQERASLYKNPTDIKASVRRFRQEFQQFYDPGEKSYEVAAQVQRPAAQYRGRYRERAAEAARIDRSLGGGAPNVNVGSGSVYETRTRTVPGVDRSADRQALKLQYLQNSHDPDALLNLGLSLRDAQDTPSTTTKTRVRVKGAGGSSAGGKKPGKGSTDILHIIELAKKRGLHVGENSAAGGVNPVHTEGSYHYRTAKDGASAAADISGTPEQMRKFARLLARRYGRDLEELIWRGRGARTIKKGRRVPKNFYSAHEDHVHVADTD